MFNVVVLAAPFGPSNPTISPAAIDRDPVDTAGRDILRQFFRGEGRCLFGAVFLMLESLLRLGCDGTVILSNVLDSFPVEKIFIFAPEHSSAPSRCQGLTEIHRLGSRHHAVRWRGPRRWVRR